MLTQDEETNYVVRTKITPPVTPVSGPDKSQWANLKRLVELGGSFP